MVDQQCSTDQYINLLFTLGAPKESWLFTSGVA